MNNICHVLRVPAAASLGVILGVLSLGSAATAELSVGFSDPMWDGKTVPETKVCKKYDGDGSSPAMTVSGLPAGTVAVEIAFSDDSYDRMGNGGHGVLRFAVPSGQSMVELPAVPGETKDLPEGVSMVKAHKGRRGQPGAYLAPCSGWNGNWYSASVKAVGSNQVLARGSIKLGKF